MNRKGGCVSRGDGKEGSLLALGGLQRAPLVHLFVISALHFFAFLDTFHYSISLHTRIVSWRRLVW